MPPKPSAFSFLLFLALPAGVFLFVSLGPKFGVLKTLLGFLVLALAISAYSHSKT